MANDSMFAEELAMVGGHNDQRIVQQLTVSQRPQDLSDLVIDQGDGAVVRVPVLLPGTEPMDELVRRGIGLMCVEEIEEGKERPVVNGLLPVQEIRGDPIGSF